MRPICPVPFLALVGRTRVLLPGGVGQSFSRGSRKCLSPCFPRVWRNSPSQSLSRSFVSSGYTEKDSKLDRNRLEGRRTFFSSSALRRGKDLYETLELTKEATPKEIKAAFYRLSKKYHPDLNPGDRKAEEMFKAVSAAYNVLGDASIKAQYDRDQASSFSSSRTSYSSDGRRKESDGFSSQESADWRFMDNDRMMREQEEVWRRLKEHEEKFGRGQRNDYGFGHFDRTARPGRTPPDQSETDRERLYREYMEMRERKFGNHRRTSKIPPLREMTLGQLMVLSFVIGLVINIVLSILSPPPDPYSPFHGRGPPKW